MLAFLAYLLPLVFYSDVQHYFETGLKLGWHSWPYRDFTFEFPPLAIFALLLVPLTGSHTVPYHIVFVVILVMFEWATMHTLRRFDPDRFWEITGYWSAVIVPFSLLAWNRLDFISVLLATLGLVSLLRGRPIVHWVVLGFLAKLWPVLLCVALFTQRKFKELAWSIVGVIAVTALWYGFSPDGFREFLEYRRGAGFQIESLPGAILHHFGRGYFFESGTVSVPDDGWQWLQPVMFGATIVGIGALTVAGFLRKERDDVMLIGACVALALVFSRIISPQFLIWLAPFITLRATQHVKIALLYVASLVLSVIVLSDYQTYVDSTHSWLTAMQMVRNGVLLVLAVAMAWVAFQPQQVSKTATDHSGS